jgi:hypothetical protein
MANLEEIFGGEAETYTQWRSQYFSSPPPDQFKKLHLLGYLLKLPKETTVFIETGTFQGSTAKLVAELGYKVITIELSTELHARARELLEPLGVTCLNGDSGSLLKQALADVAAQTNVFLWLDGHYSAGVTAKGSLDTPISRELFAVENHLRNTDAHVLVKVDDIRGFGTGDYPSLDKLVDFANRNFLKWTIELDSFICSNRPEFLKTRI